jgi:hypothetical protein
VFAAAFADDPCAGDSSALPGAGSGVERVSVMSVAGGFRDIEIEPHLASLAGTRSLLAPLFGHAVSLTRDPLAAGIVPEKRQLSMVARAVPNVGVSIDHQVS